VTANSASGSKYYDIKTEDPFYGSVINQEYVRNYSHVEVTDESITVTTLRSEESGGGAVNSVVDEVTLNREDDGSGDGDADADADADGADADATDADADATDADADADATDAADADATDADADGADATDADADATDADATDAADADATDGADAADTDSADADGVDTDSADADGVDTDSADADGSDTGDDTPDAPSLDSLDEATRTLDISLNADNTQVTGTIGASAAGAEHTWYVYSDPQLLGTATADDEGATTLSLPALAAGEHTLVALDASGEVVAWNTFSLSEATDGELAVTGGSVSLGAATAAGVLVLLGAGLLIRRRRTA